MTIDERATGIQSQIAIETITRTNEALPLVHCANSARPARRSDNLILSTQREAEDAHHRD